MEFYHVLNRGVDKRTIVLDDKDRARFLHDLFVFNDQEPVLHYRQPNRRDERRSRKTLVQIHAFCLMRNHYHLLLSSRVDDGISLFMKKLNMGYAKYFNERHGRTGALWQGKYKKILIERDAHFMYIPYYIHLNPLDFGYPEWREGKVRNAAKALAFLESYCWSSHRDYCGVRNFPSLTQRDFLSHILGSRKEYEKQIIHIITDPELVQESVMLE